MMPPSASPLGKRSAIGTSQLRRAARRCALPATPAGDGCPRSRMDSAAPATSAQPAARPCRLGPLLAEELPNLLLAPLRRLCRGGAPHRDLLDGLAGDEGLEDLGHVRIPLAGRVGREEPVSISCLRC